MFQAICAGRERGERLDTRVTSSKKIKTLVDSRERPPEEHEPPFFKLHFLVRLSSQVGIFYVFPCPTVYNILDFCVRGSSDYYLKNT